MRYRPCTHPAPAPCILPAETVQSRPTSFKERDMGKGEKGQRKEVKKPKKVKPKAAPGRK